MPSDSLSIRYDHYKDTCAVIAEAVKKRDRAMLYVIAAVGLFAFQTMFPSVADGAVAQFLNFKYGLTFSIDLSVIGNAIWLAVLVFALRYFQSAVFVERQYDYIHRIEEELNKTAGEEVITREGKSYLKDYPWFSDWMTILYKAVFPLLLILVTATEIGIEWVHLSGRHPSLGLLFNSLVFLLLAVSVFLYWGALYRKAREEE
jgi:hypothetical protein